MSVFSWNWNIFKNTYFEEYLRTTASTLEGNKKHNNSRIHEMFETRDSTKCLLLFHDGGRYHIETSPLFCSASQWTAFYMITASVMKELIISVISVINIIHYFGVN